MCASFYIRFQGEDKLKALIHKAYQQSSITFHEGTFFPSAQIPVLVLVENQLQVTLMHWGYLQEQGLLINARSETMHEKMLFKQDYREHRCVVIASGYYEYNEHKNRYAIHQENQPYTYLAGIYHPSETGGSLVIVTEPAASNLRMIHDRMPLMLTKQSLMAWLEKGLVPEPEQGDHLAIHLDSSHETITLF